MEGSEMAHERIIRAIALVVLAAGLAWPHAAAAQGEVWRDTAEVKTAPNTSGAHVRIVVDFEDGKISIAGDFHLGARMQNEPRRSVAGQLRKALVAARALSRSVRQVVKHLFVPGKTQTESPSRDSEDTDKC